jgi:hypothetical protein
MSEKLKNEQNKAVREEDIANELKNVLKEKVSHYSSEMLD